MPEVRNCKRCKKIFMYVLGPQICDECKKREEEDYEKVRRFVKDYPGATIQEVSAATEVPTTLIYRFLREGRLEVSDESPITLQCENCGVRIRSGRFCIECSKRLARDMLNAGRSLNDVLRSEVSRDKDNVGLRYLHGERKDK
jgi:flagellar operon protein (TIGR03826 family)